MYTGLYNLKSPRLWTDSFAMAQGLRALAPVLALYLTLPLILTKISGFLSTLKNPLGFLFGYASIGIIAAFFSPEPLQSAYWGFLYISAPLVAVAASLRNGRLEIIRMVIYLNYALAILMVLLLVPEALKIGLVRTEAYPAPFGLGEMRANGVGRFALAVIIVAFVRFLTQSRNQRIIWLALLVPALYLLVHSESRSSILGFAIAGVLVVYLRGLDWKMVFAGPIGAYAIYYAGFHLRANGELEKLASLTGRDITWRMGIDLFKESPIFGWGFHADRIMLEFQHMHNSYFQALVQSGMVGTIFFTGAIAGIWVLVFKYKLFKKARRLRGPDQALLIECLLFLAFLTARSLFESTGAFYGVDLLILVPIMGYLQLVVKEPDPPGNGRTKKKPPWADVSS